jgi:hypothetical protein
MRCRNKTWQFEATQCAASTQTAKNEIRYLDAANLKQLHDATMTTRLATYRYKTGNPKTHLGFIIEDQPLGPAILPSGQSVDLYAYLSMTVATLQVQEAEIARLRADLNELQKDHPKPNVRH